MGIIDIENTCVIAEDNNFDDNELRTLFLKQNIDFNAVNDTGKSQFWTVFDINHAILLLKKSKIV